MKAMISTIVITTALALAAVAAQPNGAKRNILPGDGSAFEKSIDPTAEQLNNLQQQLDESQILLQGEIAASGAKIKKKSDEQAAAAETLAEAADAEAAAGAGASIFDDSSGFTRFENIVRQGHGGGRALVIRSSESEGKSQAGLEEDLAVMSHILNKTVDEKVGSQRSSRKAMGINLVFAGTSSPFQSMYLDGYGALFLVRVDFPLLPGSKPETPKEKTETSSTWEEARQELYGHADKKAVTTTPAVEYDEEKVTDLKNALLEALKNASNIRDLKVDDSITVCVFGGNSGRFRSSQKRSGTTTTIDSHVWVLTDGAANRSRGSIMTIRVKKSDADAFSKGKLDLDEFRKKAKVTTYFGNADVAGVNTFSYGNGYGFSFGR
jgi:hypothetical protein